ncbi:EAL domain-containing protein [Porphyrobacter sp. YT40]|uniref:putative bifunctional diguanylate cyclase/phosphodiesterase n=1 Tax=Porphyrobacter sp. YT40 TaxID=2547601 RepID=UPI0011430CDA|nr:EAL domain-containing protein [Porphyrobacter sp. YT40]QDH32963.1 EAL domain-containing protein [Porphyrobacter sp. YT40]
MTKQAERSGAASADRRWISAYWLKPKSWAFSDDPDVLIGQYANLRRQVPLLYLLLIIIAFASVYLMAGSVPILIIGPVVGLFVTVASIRMVWWLWFLPEPGELDVSEVRALLRRTTWAVLPICLSYLGYSFLLDAFGDPGQRAGVAICLVMTAIGCIFCLMHLPQAALLVNLTTMVPYALYQVISGNETFLMVSLIAGIVTTLMFRVSLNAHETFIELINSRSELAAQRGEAERLASENASFAMTDALTGLPNRRLFLARLDDRVQQSIRDRGSFVVGVLDLDRFKPVNDIYGHAVGDQLLVEVGQRLQSLSGANLLIARLGGDEFGLLVDGDDDAAAAIGAQVIAMLHQPFQIDGQRLSVGCSIGFASFPYAGASASVIFDRADYALYTVKADRRGAFAFFTPHLETRLRTETELEAALLSADLANELGIALQPIICLRTAQVRGVEALARWHSARIGDTAPTRFIDAAERLNIMGNITTTLFTKALASMAALPVDIDLSFNLSTRDIVTSATIDMLIAAIVDQQVDPQRVTFEITETALMQDYDTAIAHIERLRAMGVAIALDDFGTGFSSLSYLSRLPIDKIKIDRSFVSNLAEPGVHKIVTAILTMCETLDVECIAEGVETSDDCFTLKGMGCNLAQGFAFARPMDIASLQTWLERENGRAADGRARSGLLSLPAFAELHERFPTRAGASR